MSESLYENLPMPNLSPDGRRQVRMTKWTRYGDAQAAWLAEHDLGAPPEVRARLHELVAGGAFGYHFEPENVLGSFSRWTTQRHGWTPDPELGILTENVLQGIWLGVEVFTQPGDGVVISTPIYPPFLDISPSTARRQVEWPMYRDDQGWHNDLDGLESLLAGDPGIRLMVLCHPHNPTGVVFTEAELARIVALATQHNVKIISDEIHGDLVHPGAKHIPMLTIPGAEACTVTLASGVKTFGFGGIKCAVAQTANENLLENLQSVSAKLLGGGANRMGAEATVAAWDNGQSWLDELKLILDANRHCLVDRLAAELPRVRVHLPQATFLGWLDFSAYSPDDRTDKWLLRHTGLAGQDGENFGSQGANHVRFTFGVAPELLNEMIDQMVEGLSGI